ncbi:MAG TPA: radical SAM protein [Kofleriaceae bacterium]
MRDRPTANPANRFASTSIEYDPGDGPPPSSITLLVDHSRSILSHNDSPDLGFSWSCNPYRGCIHACTYCGGGDTPVLMADGATRLLADLHAGDRIIGTRIEGGVRRYTPTTVLDQWTVARPAYRITLESGARLLASADHRFLGERGWTHVGCLAPGNSLVGSPAAVPEDIDRAIVGSTPVVSIEPVGKQVLYDITTGTGDFIANGVVSHNCYARPTHEYLDMGAGTDFDTKIVYKPRAAELLRGAFDAKKWKGELVMFSGVTDCYQPFEAKLGLTRACLEVCLEYRNPVSVISKSALVERDIDLFQQLAAEADCHVSVSLAFIDADAARAVEPWAPSPERRLKVIEAMAKAGVPVGIMVAPVIPGLNDRDLPALLARAREAGASSAGWALLRLPGAVAPVFEERVRAAMPLRADKILARVRDTRSGKIYDSRFHLRGRGEGRYAETIAALFEATALRLGLKRRHRDAYDEGDNEDLPQTFRRPERRGPQLSLPLFGDD